MPPHCFPWGHGVNANAHVETSQTIGSVANGRAYAFQLCLQLHHTDLSFKNRDWMSKHVHVMRAEVLRCNWGDHFVCVSVPVETNISPCAAM